MTGPSDFFDAVFVADIAEIEEMLARDLTKSHRDSQLAALVYANARKEFVRTSILPLVPYWNYRSRDYVSFFFVGYDGDIRINESDFYTATHPESSFQEQIFVSAIDQVEGRCGWRYRGDTPLILTRAYLDRDAGLGRLDLESVVELELERALRDDAIDSVESFFEAIISAAKDTPGDDVHWRLSDSLGARALGDALVDAVASKVPGSKRLINAVRFFRVKRL
jgi:hypothetical protein